VRGAVAKKEDEILTRPPPPSDLLTEQESLAVCFAERVPLDPHTVDDEFFRRLQGNFSDEQIVGLAFAATVYIFGVDLQRSPKTDLESEELEYEDTLTHPDGNVAPKRRLFLAASDSDTAPQA
jgi:hypothetical protein